MKTTANFVLDGNRIEITLDTERNYISFTGTAGDGSSGQVCGTIRKLYDESSTYSDDLETVLALWDEWHLKSVIFEAESAIATARQALINLDQRRFPEEAEGGKAEDFEEADFNEHSDVIDSRDVIARIEYLRDFLADLPDDVSPATYDPEEMPDTGKPDPNGNRADAVEEFAALRELEEAASGYAPDWRYGETLIHSDYFTEYAEEMVKETAGLPRDLPSWLVIDWEATAQNLKVDYTEVTFKGETFYVR